MLQPILLETMQQTTDFIKQNPVAVVIVVQESALSNQAKKDVMSFLPEDTAVAVVNIKQNDQFQSKFTVLVTPCVYIFKNKELETEFVLPFDKEQILCALQ